MVLAGASTIEAAREVGYSVQIVRKWLRMDGRWSRNKTSPQTKKQAIEMVLSGASTVEAAQKIGHSARVIRKWLHVDGRWNGHLRVGMRRLTELQKLVAIEIVLSGDASAREVALAYNVGYSTICQLVSNTPRAYPTNTARKATVDDYNEMCRLLAQGMRPQNIAETMNRAPSTIHHWIRRGQPTSAYAQNLEAKREAALALVKKGLTVRRICAQVHCSTTTLRTWRKLLKKESTCASSDSNTMLLQQSPRI
jgi:transposase-like protein